MALFLGFLFVKYNLLEVYGYGEDEIRQIVSEPAFGTEFSQEIEQMFAE